MSEALLITLVGIVGTIVGTIVSTIVNRVANRKKNKVDIQNIEEDVITKLQKNYSDVLDQLHEERNKADNDRKVLNDKIDQQSQMISDQNDKIDAQNTKIDKLLGLMNFICLDMACKERQVCPKEDLEGFIEIK
jgi:uncharacterized membrane protein YgaE (UPF0421/DUF939 family)